MSSEDDQEPWLNDGEQRAWRSYLLGTQLLLDRLDRDLRTEHGLTFAEYEVLVRLSEAPDHRLRMAVLAQSLCHSRSRLSHTVKRMQEVGLVQRCASADDGRGVFACLTDEGYSRLKQAAPSHARGVRDYLVNYVPASSLDSIKEIFDDVANPLLGTRPESADIRRTASD